MEDPHLARGRGDSHSYLKHSQQKDGGSEGEREAYGSKDDIVDQYAKAPDEKRPPLQLKSHPGRA